MVISHHKDSWKGLSSIADREWASEREGLKRGNKQSAFASSDSTPVRKGHNIAMLADKFNNATLLSTPPPTPTPTCSSVNNDGGGCVALSLSGAPSNATAALLVAHLGTLSVLAVVASAADGGGAAYLRHPVHALVFQVGAGGRYVRTSTRISFLNTNSHTQNSENSETGKPDSLLHVPR